jgi:hypothetical protein
LIDIILGFAAFILCLFLVFKLNSRLNIQLSFKFVATAFVVRVLAGVVLTLIYTYYYPDRTLSDTFRYFDDSYFLHQLLLENPKEYFLVMIGVRSEVRESIPLLEAMTNWFPALRSPMYNDNRTVIRINAIMHWFSFGSYYVHMCLFAFMGFVGQIFIFKAFQKYFDGKEFLLGLVVFLIPSLVFWTSGILKEGPLFLALGLLLYLMEKVARNGFSKKEVALVALLFLFLFHMKFYVGLMLVPVFSLYLVFNKWTKTERWKLVFYNYSSYFVLATIWHFIRFKWSLFTVFKWKKKDFQGLAESMDARSLIETYNLEDNALSFIVNIPQGLFNALFRPFVWEAYSLLILMNAIENLMLLGFMGVCFYFRKKVRFSDMSLCFLVYALSLLVVVGMVTPIMGSLVRYKIPALPFLLMFFVCIVDLKRLKDKFPLLKKF